jgi:osmotically-inducible protein OsmY
MMSTVGQAKPQITKLTTEQQVSRAVERRFEGHAFGHVYSQVTWVFENGTLTLSGCVPSFYLKQMLQETLRDIDQVKQIDNQVNVVNSGGLSSVPWNKPR